MPEPGRVQVDVAALRQAGHLLREPGPCRQRRNVGDLTRLVEEDARELKTEDLVHALGIVEATEVDLAAVGQLKALVSPALLQGQPREAMPDHGRQRVSADRLPNRIRPEP